MDRIESAAEPPRLVVGVGASAGGLDAFKELLAALPDDAGFAYLLVQHLDPAHDSLLTELLRRHTTLRVLDAAPGLRVERDCVYIIQPDTSMGVQAGQIELSKPELHRGIRLPVDYLFRSLAREYGRRAAGILLSGAGSDGSSGIRDIKGAGGLALAQDPSTAAHSGMPASAIETGVIDLVTPISGIPAALERFASLPEAEAAPDSEPDSPTADELFEPQLTEDDLRQLATVLRAHLDFDLRVYKLATVERRVLRRMALAGFDRVEPYLHHLRTESDEPRILVRDLLISVTDFFRDPECFEELRRRVIEPLVKDSAPGTILRCWVPGCATGEEAYSLAIELVEAADAHGSELGVQVFATDVDRDALEVARQGIYPPAIVEHISPARLSRHFKRLDGKGYQVRQSLRDKVSFSVHDLAKDPPFSRMHLVSCRNLLIYFTQEAQQHALKLLHFALVPDGHLFLSTSESTGRQRDLFHAVSKGHSIFRKVGRSLPTVLDRSHFRLETGTPSHALRRPRSSERRTSSDIVRDAVLRLTAPPTIVVSEDGLVIFSQGTLDSYLRIPEGDNPRFELSGMLQPSSATRVRGALYKCRRTGEVVRTAWTGAREGWRVRLTATPLPTVGEGVVMLTFEEELLAEPVVQLPQLPDSGDDPTVVVQLENELQATREDLRNTVEELETSNEELRSANEESMSMNEELQSANEELEATAEELRSLNEELSTINAQLRDKIEQVERAHDSLHNFFASTEVATIFLDQDLRIRELTPAAKTLLEIDHGDVGRPISDIAREQFGRQLVDEAHEVIEKLIPRTRELRLSDGRWIVRRVLPYRTERRRIEGVVVTFEDATERRALTDELEARSRRLELAWEVARGGMLEYRDPIDDSTYISAGWARVLGFETADLPQVGRLRSWFEERLHPEGRGRWKNAREALIEGRSEEVSLEHRVRHRDGRWIWVRTTERALERSEEGHLVRALQMIIDIDAAKQTEARIQESEERFREMIDALPLIVWVHDHEGRQELVNQTYCDYFGVSREEMVDGHWQVLVHPDDTHYAREFEECVRQRKPFHAEVRVKRADGAWRWLESWGRPRYTPAGEFMGFIGTSADITDRRRSELDLRQSQEALSHLLDEAPVLVAIHEGPEHRYLYSNRRYDEAVGRRKLRGLALAEALPELAGQGIMERYDQVFERGRVSAVPELAVRLIEEPSRVRYFTLVLQPRYGKLGTVEGIVSFSFEITDQVAARHALRESEERLRVAARAATFGTFDVDVVNDQVHWSDGMYKILGLPDQQPSSPMGTVPGCVHPEDRARVQTWIERLLAPHVEEEVEFEDEHRIVRNDGATRWVLMRGRASYDPHREYAPRRVTGVLIDLTERKQAEEALKEKSLLLEAEDQRKSLFIATLGHEIRNPLAALDSALRVVDADIASATEVYPVVRAHVRQLIALSDDLLEVSRVTSGKVSIRTRSFDLVEALGRAIEAAGRELEDKRQTFEASLPERLRMVGEPSRIEQIATNLLLNAARFTPEEGHVELEVTAEEEHVVIEVRDTGIGIEADQLDAIFDPFVQAWPGSGGLGIGLALVRGLTRLHGGEITAHSRGRGEGSAFRVRLPIGEPSQAPAIETDASRDPLPLRLKILVVDDVQDSAELLASLLRRDGAVVETAYTGEAAVQRARQFEPHVALIDLGLPDISGCDVARRLREEEGFADALYLAVTGFGDDFGREEVDQAGFAERLVKPLDHSRLNTLLKQRARELSSS